MKPQEFVLDQIEKRGYLDQGLNLEETAARQVAKLGEELCELAMLSSLSDITGDWFDADTKGILEFDFDDVEEWTGASIDLSDSFGKELADIGVVLFSMSEIYNRLRKENGQDDFDIIEAIKEKAARDVARGVR